MMVTNCNGCCQFSIQPTELLISTFSSITLKLTYLAGKQLSICCYTIDYYSTRYIKVAKLPSKISSTVIQHIHIVFACHGIPQEVQSNNGPQFSSALFHTFSTEHNFTHITNSHQYPAGHKGLQEQLKAS